MSKNILMIGILFGLVSSLVFWWLKSPLGTKAENMHISATYNEQQGYEQFVKQLPQQKWDKMNWNSPFYMNNGGLPRYIRDCEAYITVSEILVKQEEPKEEPKEEPQKELIEKPQQEVQRKRIALTFDDGPNDKNTVQILSILQKYDVKATFFVIGLNVVKHPEIVKLAAQQGHEIASHTWSHKNLTKLTPAQLHDEIDRASNAIFEAIGQYPTTYRPPYGAINANVRDEIKMKSILWNIDTMDWQHKTPAKTLANVKLHAKDGGVILMHDIHKETAEALEAVIQYLIQENYEFVTVEELYK
ncbi:polysaccharide deacetylase family protein [Solibacillus daqui]|uniref:polysaccharide deacetylase family protein n=1 Tax=Solibacillus daqui TaxID=2912187 RepID=UPI002365019B|nr:polysaccharide deacetylase family protein [Solibacillus daqui]